MTTSHLEVITRRCRTRITWLWPGGIDIFYVWKFTLNSYERFLYHFQFYRIWILEFYLEVIKFQIFRALWEMKYYLIAM